jgi:hypothetical protein
MEYKRKEHELPLATEKWGWKYHHFGIPVKEPIPGEHYIPHLKFYVKGFEYAPIELMELKRGCPKRPETVIPLKKGILYLSIKLIVIRSPIKPGMTKTIFWTPSSYKGLTKNFSPI